MLTDFVLAGPASFHEKLWEDLAKVVIIDDVGSLGRFLGRHHGTIKYKGDEQFCFDMRAYAESTVAEYVKLERIRQLENSSNTVH